MGQMQPLQSTNALQAWGNTGNGRAIFASGTHRQLLDQFLHRDGNSSSEDFQSQQLIRSVNSLRASVSPLNSMLKPRHPTRRLLVTGHFEIEYKLNNYHGDCQTDIEIVDVRLINREAEDGQRPALWRVKYNPKREEWKPERLPRHNLQPNKVQPGSKENPLKVGINGNGQTLEEAVRTLGDHIARGNKKKYGDYQLFYVPSTGGALAGDWVAIKSLGLQGTDEQRLASRLLALYMYEAHRRKLHVEWIAHSHGSWVLTEAMRHLAQRKIDLQKRQKIFFSDATASHVVANQLRHNLNMATGDDCWHNFSLGVAQLAGGLHFGAALLLCELNELRHYTAKDEKPEKIGGLVWWAGITGLVVHGLVTKIIASGTVPVELALLGTCMIIASLPSAKKKYYRNPCLQLLDWLRHFGRIR
ncbi:hypothetical protein Q2E61_00730 [Microbulbifer thermotolerans]|uniref:hypothetical protein n=1 Tax=Microbulbifer thermotolerans TaxID=252514 RepID=UPI002672C778|nr:hypothetical protein [Microbulbifer thermotolerans]WKT60755.1 hypothetical protein Q2E61_00730 [Microbulbifer thermotolerans]